jgi:hypothetical protein
MDAELQEVFNLVVASGVNVSTGNVGHRMLLSLAGMYRQKS